MELNFNNVIKVYIGNTEVNSVYVLNELVFNSVN